MKKKIEPINSIVLNILVNVIGHFDLSNDVREFIFIYIRRTHRENCLKICIVSAEQQHRELQSLCAESWLCRSRLNISVMKMRCGAPELFRII